MNKKRRVDSLLESTRSSKTAATYSPTRQGSTIGVGGLNFSVRDGKRWNPAAIATSIRVTHWLKSKSFIKPWNERRTAPQLRTISGICVPIRCQRKPRAISSARLKASLPVHLHPINVLVSDDPQGDLILRPASCLDAFSIYPITTWIPGGAAGATTGKPEVGPARSSRTSASSTQVSCAHDR